MMMAALDKARIGTAALAVGIAQAGLEAALDDSRTRREFGRPIAEHQGLGFLLADTAKDIHAARLLVHDAARRMDAGENATPACSIAKLMAGDVAVARSADPVQIFGGSRCIRGFEVERLDRDVRITQIRKGSQQIQRTIIARELVRHGAVQ